MYYIVLCGWDGVYADVIEYIRLQLCGDGNWHKGRHMAFDYIQTSYS